MMVDPDRVREAVELWHENGLTIEFLEGMTYNHRVALVAAARLWLEGTEIRWCEEHNERIPRGTNPDNRCWFSWHYLGPEEQQTVGEPCRVGSRRLVATGEDE